MSARFAMLSCTILLALGRSACRRHRSGERHRLSRAGAVRRLAGQPRHVELGKRDAGRLQRRLLQGQWPRSPRHRSRPARRTSAGPQPRRRRDLEDRKPGRAGGTHSARRGAARHRTAAGRRSAVDRLSRRHRLHASRFRHDAADERQQRRRSRGSTTRPIAAIIGRGPSSSRCSVRRASRPAPTTSSTVQHDCLVFLTAAKTERSRGAAVLRPHHRRRQDAGTSSAGSPPSRAATRSCRRPCGSTGHGLLSAIRVRDGDEELDRRLFLARRRRALGRCAARRSPTRAKAIRRRCSS